ncbi:hypothetical protein QVD17_33929 [Tagetes erecta]|uniref:Uncharacterized protein n=1 Tax=Tagetes erecta TaxID=13708 RepID=A0AAD8JX59_TARER|nr:hypothetical protein QVD17_33929 [Tagetes erecta]
MVKHSNSTNLLEALLLTLKRCLPRFKFASGTKVCDEMKVIVVQNDKGSGNNEMGEISNTKELTIFQGKRSSLVPKASDKRKQPVVMNDKKRRRERPKNDPIECCIEEVQEQFGKTMEEAAGELGIFSF